MILESANHKEIEIAYDIPIGLTVFADKNLLQTIIRNLVSNAVKFTEKGGKIIISACATSDNSVEIAIKDSGIGMNFRILNNLFHIDVQTNRKGTNDEPSTGLGLILCKEFVEKHGGKLWAESEVGKGSIFYFTLPSIMETEEKP
jgi:signal transduction histidine kinase